MKNLIYIVASTLFFTASCSERDNGEENLSSTLQEGNWRVSSFDYTDRELSGYYKDYKFTFTVQNTVTAIGVNFYAGKWEVKRNNNRLVLALEFTKLNPIQLLNYEWVVINYNPQTINLEWDNPYFGGKDYLTFEKN